MADMEARIHPPVAVPQKFLGAPAVPVLINLTVLMLAVLACFAIPSMMVYGIGALFLIFPVHIGLMWWGSKEPHLSSLIQKQGEMRREARQVGGGRSKVFRAG